MHTGKFFANVTQEKPFIRKVSRAPVQGCCKNDNFDNLSESANLIQFQANERSLSLLFEKS
jgi:hypothetical protein